MSPADLVTLAQAQAYIGNAAAGNSAKVAQLITSISMAIRRMTDCVINPSSFTESYDGSPLGITLRNWPVIAISGVTVMPACYYGLGGNAFPTSPMLASVNGSNGYVLDVELDPQASTPQMLRSIPSYAFPKGTKNVSVSYSAGYQITGEAAVVPPSGGEVTVQQPYGAWGSDQGVSYASGGALQAVTSAPAQGQYNVAAGVYTFSSADAGAGFLISYGYVPADIANAALEWIADRVAYQDRVGIASKSLGGQETTSYRTPATPAFVAAMLQPFTNVVPIG